MRVDVRRGMTREAEKIDKVYLDGVEVHGVLMFDTKDGVIIRHKRDTFTGKLLAEEERVHGVVTYTPKVIPISASSRPYDPADYHAQRNRRIMQSIENTQRTEELKGLPDFGVIDDATGYTGEDGG